MADKELAAKLQRRFAALSIDEDSADAVQESENSTIPAPPPPPPNEAPQCPFLESTEIADIDRLINETLERKQSIPSAKINGPSYNSMTSTEEQRPVIPPVMAPLENNQIHAEAAVQSRMCAPVVPIVHHKEAGKKPHPVHYNDDSYEKGRRELEEKLAKQRQKKPSNPQPDLLVGIDSGSCITEPSHTETTENQNVAPVSPSADSGISVRSPPPVAKKPNCSLVNANHGNQAPVSPTCSSTSNRSNFSEESEELASKLARRNLIVEGEPVEPAKPVKLGLYSEFHEFSRKQIKYFIETFKRFDEDGDSFIDFNELKRMMEKLGEAQTHIALKSILKMVDEDKDGKVSLREFMLIFRYAATGQLTCAEVFNQLASSVDVTKEGVQGAANFFQAKIEELSRENKFEKELKAEREERKQLEQERKERRQQFLANKAAFL